MSSVGKISGFPEWLPEEKILENELIQKIKTVYESFGFAPIETPAVELVTTLASKGVIDKEIFAVKRLRDEGDKEADLALHFDLTVPFARYVALHSRDLVFPFKRYQVQKVWRGDRPQKGRFREFYQFDNDTVARDELPLSCDAEAYSAITKALIALKLPPFVSRINNRKILEGFYRSLGLTEAEVKSAITVVDKLDKIEITGVQAELEKLLGAQNSAVHKIVELVKTKATPGNLRAVISEFKISDSWFDSGLTEMERVLELLPDQVLSNIEIDFSLARGLAYYTGLISEFYFPDHKDFGTFAGGGRYDDLASDFTKEKLPGVGFSIGLSRLFDLILTKQLLPVGPKSPSKAVVTVYSEEQRAKCSQVAEELRSHGVSCEVYFKAPKLGKQIEYAEAKGIPYVVFVNPENGNIEIKNLKTKEQVVVSDLGGWAKEI